LLSKLIDVEPQKQKENEKMKTYKIAILAIITLLAFGLMVAATAQNTMNRQDVVTGKTLRKQQVSPSTKEVKQEAKKVVPEKDIAETAMARPELKTFVSALQAAGMVDVFKGKGPFTVFAPNDEAFAKIPKADLDALLADKAKLTSVLNNHVAAAKYNETKLMKMKDLKTVDGQTLTLMPMEKTLKVGNAQVVKGNIRCSNGVIHIVDTVLMPTPGTAPTTAPK
jgi:uncharacterized surface protein with fasciclin (FAS1) repeats